MKPSFHPRRSLVPLALLAGHLLTATAALAQRDDLVGIWIANEGFQMVELRLRSDGRYQWDTRSTDPVFDVASSERGRYEVAGSQLVLTSYDYLGEPQGVVYGMEMNGNSLTLTRPEFSIVHVFTLKTGSRDEVLAGESVEPDLIAAWSRQVPFVGTIEYTFRPGGYYFVKTTYLDDAFPPELVRGRYRWEWTQLTLQPYGGIEATVETDFYDNTLTLIRSDPSYGESTAYERVPGSGAEVRAKSAEADAFLARADWQVGFWEIRGPIQDVDLTFRPDGHYSVTNSTEVLQGTVRGRYVLEPRRIHFAPFVGQALYSRDNGEFGKVPRRREIDYYEGELQLIDPEAIAQSVTLARMRPGSAEVVRERVRQAQSEREREDWHLGIWEVQDPTGWMEFTYRPDGRYIAASGDAGVPSRVERGRYRITGQKVTLAPYAGLGPARGFEWDLYDGEWSLIGDSLRMVVARKVPGSEAGVIEKTRQPASLLGERGSVLGRWTAHLPGRLSELVFRPDGEFRLNHCQNDSLTQDYGLHLVNMTSRTLVLDSRFSPVQTHDLDFYGDTMTIHGGLGPPQTYTVNLGTVDASIEASLAADAAKEVTDAQWLARVPIGPRDPNAVYVPTGNLPADPNPGRTFASPTVLTRYQLYRRMIPGFVYFNHLGSIVSVAVVDTREWHFFPTGRVLVRFTHQRAGVSYPTTVTDVSDGWGAYLVGPQPEERDILHRYADNSLFIETDLGEQSEMTLEDGRRNLFWGKDYQVLSEWAAEREPIPCTLTGEPDLRLLNTGIELATTLDPDPFEGLRPELTRISGPVAGYFTLTGVADVPGRVVVEQTTSLVPPIHWEVVQTQNVPAGPFAIQVQQGGHTAACFRLRGD